MNRTSRAVDVEDLGHEGLDVAGLDPGGARPGRDLARPSGPRGDGLERRHVAGEGPVALGRRRWRPPAWCGRCPTGTPRRRPPRPVRVGEHPVGELARGPSSSSTPSSSAIRATSTVPVSSSEIASASSAVSAPRCRRGGWIVRSRWMAAADGDVEVLVVDLDRGERWASPGPRGTRPCGGDPAALLLAGGRVDLAGAVPT